MFAYWLLLGVFAFGSLAEQPYLHFQRRHRDIGLLLATLLLALMVGLRFQVGGDWGSYLRKYHYFAYADFDRIFAPGDPAYYWLNWAGNQLGVGIWFVNLICALIFTWGLYRLAITQPSPWLTFVVAIPYLVIVVAMGYTRQAVAIGIVMSGLARFQAHGSVLRFTVYVVAAALFHRTAVVALPLVVLGGRRKLAINLLLAAAGTVALYDALLAPAMDRLVDNYVKVDQGSQGAAIRVAMSVIPAVIFFAIRDRLGFTPRERVVWRNFALGSLSSLVGLALFTSTAVDRLALYLLPLQIAVIPRLSSLLLSRKLGTVLVLIYAVAIQATWLTFANNANYWLPYQFYPLAQ